MLRGRAGIGDDGNLRTGKTGEQAIAELVGGFHGRDKIWNSGNQEKYPPDGVPEFLISRFMAGYA